MDREPRIDEGAFFAMFRGPAEPEGRFDYLPALDGLRAVAVLAVLAFHAQIGVDGGFFGVEVFFVISGYLITSLLFAERHRTGRVSLPNFWLRRARRLLPALCVLFVAVVAVSATLVPDAFAPTRGDLLGAIFFVSNWWQLAQHQSYFMAIDRPPLLLHLWSLAIEEQFYLVWPVLFAFVVGAWRPRRLAAVATAVAVASAAWMALSYDPAQDTSGVYYRTDTRLSGLLVGVALAAILQRPARRDATRWGLLARDGAALAGSALLGWALWRLRDTDPLAFRGGFLLVDVATAALVVAAAEPATRFARALGVRPLVWVGKRSYGLYLWHWPIFAVTRPALDLPLTGASLLALRLTLTIVATEICYRLVETPVRRGAVFAALRSLAGGGSSAQQARAWRWIGSAALGLAVTTALLTGGPVRAAVGESTRALPARIDAPQEPVILSDSAPKVTGGETESASPGGAAGAPTGDGRGISLDPAWPKTLTLLTDSVTLGVKTALPAALPDWKVEVIGRPALMVKQAVPEFLKGKTVGSVVVVGLAYNSLFEKNRKNYDRWAKLWDREAESLLLELRTRGAKKIVWVTLREPTADLVTDRGRSQYNLYAWFFPYVNERLHALAGRHPDIALADWKAVSDVPGVTYDLIHLSAAGVKLMTGTITTAVLGPS